MSDVLLSFGVQNGSADVSRIKGELAHLIEAATKDPPKIQVALSVDKASINQFKSELTAIVNSISLSKGSPISISINQLGEITSKVDDVKKSMDKVSKSAKSMGKDIEEAGDKILTSGTVEYNKALKKTNDLLTQLKTNRKKWSAASEGDTSKAYKALSVQIVRLQQLRENIKSNTLAMEDFNLEYSRSARIASASRESIFSAGKNYKLGVPVAEPPQKSLTKGTIEYNDALRRTNVLLSQVRKHHDAWTAAKDGKSKEQYSALETDIANLKVLREELKSGTLTASKFKSSFSDISTDISENETTIKGFRENSKVFGKLTSDMAGFNSAMTKANTLLTSGHKNLRDWTAASVGVSSGSYDSYSKSVSELEQLVVALQNGSLTAKDFDDKFGAIKSKMTESSMVIKDAGENTKRLSEHVGGLSKKFLTWLSISQVIMLGVNTMKDMVRSVAELDSAMTELKKVTDETDETYARFLTNASARSKALGASLVDVVDVSADFARLGYSIEEASELADVAIVYKNVADGIEDINEASSSIISTMKAFDVSVGNSMSIVDKFNEVSNNFAISSAGIGEAMQRSASSMRAANNTIDETIALITAANTVVQNPETVGTSLKTISMYLRAAKVEAEEAGESTEGMAASVSKLREKILQLTNNEVDIQLDENTFKSTYQILQDISKVWKEIDDVPQAALLELIGGKRNSNVVASILENFSIAEEALKTSLESSGSALSENEKHLDSINGKIAKFKGAFESLSKTVVNGEDVKLLIDAGTGLMGILEHLFNIVNALGGMRTVLISIAGIVSVSKFEAISTALSGVSGAIKLAISSAGAFASTIANEFSALVASGMSKSAASVTALTRGVTALTATLTPLQLGFMKFFAVAAVISTVVGVLKKTSEDMREKNAKIISDAKSEIQNVEALADAYMEAKSRLDSTAESKDRLSKTARDLADAIGYEKESLDDLDESYVRHMKLKAEEALYSAQENVNSHVNNGWYRVSGKETTVRLKAMSMGLDLESGDIKQDTENILKVYDALVAEKERLVDAGEMESVRYHEIRNAINDLEPDVIALKDAQGQLNRVTEFYTLTSNKYAVSSSSISKSVGEFVNKAEAVATAIAGFGNEDSQIAISKTVEDISKLSDALTGLSEGKLNIEDVSELIQEFPELASYVDFTAKNFGNLDEGLRELIKNAPNDFIDSLKEFKETNRLSDEAAAQIDAICDAASALSDDALKSVQDISGEFGVLADSINEAKNANDELDKALSEDDYDTGYEHRVKAFEGFGETMDAGEYGSKAFSAYKEYFGLMDMTSAQIKVWMENNKKYFTEGTDGILAFMNTVESLSRDGGPLDGIASFNSDTFEFNYDINELEAFADALGWSEEMLQDFIDKYRMYVETWQSRSAQDNLTEFTNAGLIVDIDDGTFAKLDELMEYTRLSKDEVLKLIDAINALREQQGLGTIQLVSQEEIESVRGELETDPVSIEVTTDDGVFKATRDQLGRVISDLKEIERRKHQVITVSYNEANSDAQARAPRRDGSFGNRYIEANASGTSGAKRGPALLGDEVSRDGSARPELVVSGDRAYIAGAFGPEIGFLEEGDIVYTADETRRILNNSIIHNSIPAHGGGIGNGLAASGGSSGGNSSGGGSIDVDAGNSFEELYRYHQHLLEMDRESLEEYLDWLKDAYVEAYKQGQIELEDFYRYEEEVYKKSQDLFMDGINDVEHRIEILEHQEDSSKERIALYESLMASIEAEVAAARAAGLDDNDEYIQDLQDRWLSYEESIKDIEDEIKENAKDALDELIDYRVNILKKELEEERDALSKKLSDLRDFYDEQKQMLQNQRDEEKYLDAQSEKRKTVSDIKAELAQLEADDSAWAQKRRLELQSELVSAEKDLDEFEKDNSLKETTDILDKLYEEQEKNIQTQIEAIDEKLNDPNALFNQALADIRDNTSAALYQDMVEYNNKYGDGNPETVKRKWEEIYGSLNGYEEFYDEPYNDVHVDDVTGVEQNKKPQDNPVVNPPSNPPPAPEDNKPEEKPEQKPIEKGSSVTVKESATHFSSNSNNARMASFVPGGTYTVYQIDGNEILIGRNGEYTGWINKSDIVGYASGTSYAMSGLHAIDELGDEYIFESSDGNRYRMFSGGEKVLNAKATDFLYEFANSGGAVLSKMISELIKFTGLDKINTPSQIVQLSTGDIVIQGNADHRTVSEIRRQQRENIDYVLREFTRLNR